MTTDKICEPLSGNTIDWECIFGGGASLAEVEERGGKMLSCPTGTKVEPCSRYYAFENAVKYRDRYTVLPVPDETGRAEFVVLNCPTRRPCGLHTKHTEHPLCCHNLFVCLRDGRSVNGVPNFCAEKPLDCGWLSIVRYQSGSSSRGMPILGNRATYGI